MGRRRPSCSSWPKSMKPSRASGRSDVFEPADEAARGFRVGARCGVHEIAVAFHGYARQRAAQASLGLVRAKEVLRGDDRSQAFANGVHGNEKMIEAMPPFE